MFNATSASNGEEFENTNWDTYDLTPYSEPDKELFLRRSLKTIQKLKRKLRQANPTFPESSSPAPETPVNRPYHSRPKRPVSHALGKATSPLRSPSHVQSGGNVSRPTAKPPSTPARDTHNVSKFKAPSAVHSPGTPTSRRQAAVTRQMRSPAYSTRAKSANQPRLRSASPRDHGTPTKHRSSSVKKPPEHQCAICKETFKTLEHLREHIAKKHKKKFVCRYCGKRYAHHSTLITHEAVHRGQPHVCEKCGRSYQRLDRFKQHLRTHNGDGKHLCSICGAVMNTKALYEAHMDRHKGIKRHTCQKCKKRYYHTQDKTFHMKHVCGEKDRVECDICHNTFKTVKYLKVHLKIHDPRETYTCAKCGKEFVSTTGYKAHIATCNGPTGRKDPSK